MSTRLTHFRGVILMKTAIQSFIYNSLIIACQYLGNIFKEAFISELLEKVIPHYDIHVLSGFKYLE